MLALQIVAALAVIVAAALFIVAQAKKLSLDAMVQIQVGTGDSEVMSFSINTQKGESKEEKQKKIDEVFALTQDRRTHNHNVMEEIRKKSFEENEAKLRAVPDETKEGT